MLKSEAITPTRARFIPPNLSASALEAAQRALNDIAKYRLRQRNPISGDYPWILALYSNFAFRVEELPS